MGRKRGLAGDKGSGFTVASGPSRVLRRPCISLLLSHQILNTYYLTSTHLGPGGEGDGSVLKTLAV